MVPEEWTKPKVIQVRSEHQTADLSGRYLFHGRVSVVEIEPRVNGDITQVLLEVVYQSGERSKQCELTLRTSSSYHQAIELIRFLREPQGSRLEESLVGVELKWQVLPTRHVKYLAIPGLLVTTVENKLLKMPTFYSHA